MVNQRKITIEKILQDDHEEKADQKQYLRASCITFPISMLYKVTYLRIRIRLRVQEGMKKRNL